MTKRTFGICILLIAILLCAALPAQAAFAEVTPVLLLSGKTEGNEIEVTVALRNNEGIAAMLLNLEYDREKLSLIDCSREQALSTLDLVSSGNYDVYPYVLTWSGDDNDASNGKLMTFRFAKKQGADGEAFVRFSYVRNRDVNYYENGELKTRNLLTDSMKIDLSSGETTVVAPDASEETSETEKKGKTGLVVGLALGGTIGIVLIVGIPWLLVKRKRS